MTVAQNPSWIDSHCHLADPRLTDVEEVLIRSEAVGVRAWVQGGVDPDDWERQRKLRARFGPGIVMSFGLHPWRTTGEAVVREGLIRLAREIGDASALGETGLDYGPKWEAHKALQQTAFRAQLRLAQSVGKPLVLHIVRAHEEALRILGEAGPFPAGGIVHSYSGTAAQARQYVARGFGISVSGGVLRDSSQKLRETVKALALESLLVETDAPDQAPPELAEDGKNEPRFLIEIAAVVAAVRGESPKTVLDASARNAKRIFG